MNNENKDPNDQKENNGGNDGNNGQRLVHPCDEIEQEEQQQQEQDAVDPAALMQNGQRQRAEDAEPSVWINMNDNDAILPGTALSGAQSMTDVIATLQPGESVHMLARVRGVTVHHRLSRVDERVADQYSPWDRNTVPNGDVWPSGASWRLWEHVPVQFCRRMTREEEATLRYDMLYFPDLDHVLPNERLIEYMNTTMIARLNGSISCTDLTHEELDDLTAEELNAQFPRVRMRRPSLCAPPSRVARTLQNEHKNLNRRHSWGNPQLDYLGLMSSRFQPQPQQLHVSRAQLITPVVFTMMDRFETDFYILALGSHHLHLPELDDPISPMSASVSAGSRSIRNSTESAASSSHRSHRTMTPPVPLAGAFHEQDNISALREMLRIARERLQPDRRVDPEPVASTSSNRPLSQLDNLLNAPLSNSTPPLQPSARYSTPYATAVAAAAEDISNDEEEEELKFSEEVSSVVAPPVVDLGEQEEDVSEEGSEEDKGERKKTPVPLEEESPSCHALQDHRPSTIGRSQLEVANLVQETVRYILMLTVVQFEQLPSVHHLAPIQHGLQSLQHYVGSMDQPPSQVVENALNVVRAMQTLQNEAVFQQFRQEIADAFGSDAERVRLVLREERRRLGLIREGYAQLKRQQQQDMDEWRRQEQEHQRSLCVQEEAPSSPASVPGAGPSPPKIARRSKSLGDIEEEKDVQKNE